MKLTERWIVALAVFLLSIGVVGCDLVSSDDASRTPWALAGLANRDVQELKLRHGMLHAATDSGLYRTPLDSEVKWTTGGLQGKTVVDVTWREDGAMLAGVQHENGQTGPVLYKRATPDAQWTPFDTGYGPDDYRHVRALASIPGSRDTLLARGMRNVARSVDGGEQWTSVWGGWDQIGYQAPLLYVSPHDPSVVFAGGEASNFQPYLVRSPDYGATWQRASGISAGGDNAVYAIIEHPDDPGRFLLGMEGRVLRSTDGGRNWTLVYEPPQYTYVFDFAARQVGDRTLIYAAGSENGTGAGRLTLHRTGNFGESWERISYTAGPDSAATRALALTEDGGHTRLYLGTTEGVYVYRP
ncbi:MAG: WD40/YVTN/BNR-like repeat-containing protein [Salinibacter sp.]|uniref:WD40/YVTN/BNR-like repeat-containing protein n=1 Tax=Salinibacter sp. TaxID=2065818 RepID=UPI0035D3F9FA